MTERRGRKGPGCEGEENKVHVRRGKKKLMGRGDEENNTQLKRREAKKGRGNK